VSDSVRPSEERLLTFEIGNSLYALPIAGIVEVAEVDEVFAAIPTLPAALGGVINFHGDALPVLNWSALFDAQTPGNPANFLVITNRRSDVARLGVPVDRVLGLVDGGAPPSGGSEIVAERRSIEGRVANLLDPQRLVARAKQVIASSLEQRDQEK